MFSTLNHRGDGWTKRDGRVGKDIERHTRRDEKKAVQERTFTKWINMHLKKCDPPLQVNNLFTDIQDGKVLMALIEELSSYNMLDRFRPFPHRIFRLNNISKVLNFLEDRNVGLINIDANDIADGHPSVVLRLIWKIIVYFQIKQITGNLEKFPSTFSLLSLPCGSDSSGRSSPASPADDTFGTVASKGKRSSQNLKYRSTAIKTLLSWAKNCTTKHGVEIYDFGKSWRSGLAFLALVKSFCPEFVDMRKAWSSEPRLNMEAAFTMAYDWLGIPPLLAPDDVAVHSPDEQSVITYVAQFLKCCPCHIEDDASVYSSGDTPKVTEIWDRSWDRSWANSNSCVLSSKVSHEAGRGPHNTSEASQEDTQLLTSTSFKCQKQTYHSHDHVLSSLSLHVSPSVAMSEDFHSMKSSNFSYERLLSDSTGGQCCDSLACKKSMLSLEDDGKCCILSGEGLCALSVLDSDEEDAYSYILELDHKEAQSDSESNVDFELSTIINTQQTDLISSTLESQENERNTSMCQFCETQMHLAATDVLMRSSDIKDKEENTMSRESLSVLPSEHIILYQRSCDFEKTSPVDPKQHNYRVNVNTSHFLPMNQIQIHNTEKTTISNSNEQLHLGFSFEMKESIYSNNLNAGVDDAFLHVENGVDTEKSIGDHVCAAENSVLNSVLDKDQYVQNSVSDQSVVNVKTGEHAFSQTQREGGLPVTFCPTSSEVEELHMLLFLWMIIYCVFMFPHLDIFSLLNLN